MKNLHLRGEKMNFFIDDWIDKLVSKIKFASQIF